MSQHTHFLPRGAKVKSKWTDTQKRGKMDSSVEKSERDTHTDPRSVRTETFMSPARHNTSSANSFI